MGKQIHYYDIDKDWLYLSSEDAYLNEQETQKQGHPVYYCPYNATLVDLPELKEYEVAKFNGTDWDVLKDYRGRYQVDENMEVSEIRYVGDIQEGYILLTDEQAETIENDIDYYIIDNGQLIPNPDYEEIKANERKAEFESKFIQTLWGWYRKKPKGYANAPQSVDIIFNIVNASGGFTEQVANMMLFYQQPDYDKPEECTEEWLIEHQYKHEPCSIQEFMQFYIAFQTAWANDQYKGETP